MSTAQRTAPAKAPAPFDPARAAWMNEGWCVERAVWRQEYSCPSRSSAASHTLTCDPDGGRASCTCRGYLYSRETPPACPHTRAAARIGARTAADIYAMFTLPELQALDREMRHHYGEAGLIANVRYLALGEAIYAALRCQDVSATIARGKVAVLDLFSEEAV